MSKPNCVVRITGAALALALLGGCSLDAAMTSCADCGEVKSVTARIARDEIRLLTDAPTWAALDISGTKDPIVYDVRVKMDRGGSRDFVLQGHPNLRVGDRVEVRLVTRGVPVLARLGSARIDAT